MEFKIINGFPPNYQEIINAGLKPDKTTLYPFRDKIYNPSGLEIPADVLFHEQIHAQQQQAFSLAEYWWSKYINDKIFRAEQELQAFANQYIFVNNALGAKAAEECLEELSAMYSSPIYNLGVNKYQAATAIRLKAKEIKKVALANK